MKRLTLSGRARQALVLSASTAAAAFGLSSQSAEAAPSTPSIGIKFGTDRPGRPGDANSEVNSAAGVLNTVIWNNTSGASSVSAVSLNADVAGSSAATGATVTWSSPNTWSSTGAGEENNTASGENGDLMAGYLDTGGVGGQGVSITVANLPAVPAFDVYVYIQGGANNRGGNYTIAGTTKEHAGDSPFTGQFVQDVIDPGSTAGSNYLVFTGLTGTGFTLTTTPTIGSPARAGVNAIEIVQTPEPAGLAIVSIAGAALLGRFRRRRTDAKDC
jgi:hypothetical protein